MKTKKIDISKGRLSTENEDIYLLDYFAAQSLRRKQMFLIFLTPFAVLIGLVIIGQLMLIVKDDIFTIEKIISVMLFSLAFVWIIYILKKAISGMPHMEFIKEKKYYVFDVWCEKAVNNFNERTEQTSYICTLRLKDGSVMKDKYFIELREISNYKILKTSEEMKNREMLVCYFPQIKYAKLFDKAIMN